MFEKELNEFVHGVASKSGMKKNAMMRGISKKLKNQVTEDFKNSTEMDSNNNSPD